MKKFRILSIIFSLLTLLGISSCNDDDATGSPLFGPGTVFNVISKSGNLSSLEASLNTATGDLPGTLEGEGPFTVFAPTDEAFTAFAESVGFESTDDVSASEALLAAADPALLSQILTYHVIAGNLDSGSLTDGSTLTTVLGTELSVIVTADGDVQIQDATKLPQTNPVANVIEADRLADNGVVHFIDKVLIPQAAIDALNVDLRPTLVEWATGTDDLSLLVDALAKAGLVDAIAGLEEARVLAPNNQAFADLLDILGDDYTSLDDFDNEAEIALLQDILTYHVLTVEEGGSTDLMAGPAATLLEDNTVEVTAAGSTFTFGDATATAANIITGEIDAKNGAVDIIDKVLLPQAALDFLAKLASDDLATIVVGSPQLTILEEALIATDLVDTFVDMTNGVPDEMDTNFTYYRQATVFAPTDAAFTALFDALGADYNSIADFDTEEELELLTGILLYHVVAGEIGSTDLEAGAVTTLAETDIEVISVVGTEDFVIGDATNDINANIAVADVFARNGVAHVIDKVLLSSAAIDFVNSLTP